MSNAARIAAAAAVTLAAAAAAVANDAGGVGAVLVPGRPYAIGEQHVYAVQCRTVLQLRLRSPRGDLTTRTLRAERRSSVALTVEGYDVSGNPVFATAASPAGAQTDLAAADAVLRGLNSAAVTPNQSWSGDANIRVPPGALALALHVQNVAGAATGDDAQTTMGVNSNGRADVSGSASIAGFGVVGLRGRGIATGSSFLELSHRLLLGMQLQTRSNGVAFATTRTDRGTYALTVRYSVELARYVAGRIPASEFPAFAPASTYGGSPAPVDATNIGPAPVGTFGRPAPIDTEYAPLPDTAATATPGPPVSLPPIPVVAPSDQQLVSPPPPPTPTPTPRH